MLAHHLIHRSAAGSATSNVWDLDWSDSTILASIQAGSAPIVHVAIRVRPVLHRDRKKNEFAIVCVSGDADRWAIESGVYDAHLPDPVLPAMSLMLTHAPVNIAKVLSRI